MSVTNCIASFDYDAMGNRIAKHVLTSANVLESSTYYILDAQEDKALLWKTNSRRTRAVAVRKMSTYEREIISASIYYSQKERYIYGSSRLGVMSEIIPLYGSQNSTYSQAVWNDTIGKRSYELSNHLGNVLTVISDKPIPVDDANDSDIDWFLADIRQSTDYSGFGVQLENRNLLLTGVGEDYSLGFQGQFEDDEFKGEGNSVNYTYRMHDPRLGRFFAIDPLAPEYPHYTPYSFSGNKVIHAIELEGLEEFVAIKKGSKYLLHWDVTARDRDEAGTIQILDGTAIIEQTRKLLPHELIPFIQERLKYAVEVVKNEDGSYKVTGQGVTHSEDGTQLDRSNAKTSLNGVFEIRVDITDLGTKIKPPVSPVFAPSTGPVNSNIQFDVWTDNISNPTVATSTLNNYAAYLIANPGASIDIQGTTMKDATVFFKGSTTLNATKVANMRAQKVKKELMNLGVDKKQINVQKSKENYKENSVILNLNVP